jgi:hypothetical protein
MADESLQEIILAAFLAGVKAGVVEEAIPRAQKHGKQIGKRVIRGRAKSTGAMKKAMAKKSPLSKYKRLYGANFKRIAPGNKTKAGSWKKDGFKRTQKAAHAATRKEMK